MSSFGEYQTPGDSSEFLHPLVPGAHGVGGYSRAPGAFGSRNFSNNAGKFGGLKKISDPFSPAMKNGGAEEISKIEQELAYGPEDVPRTMRRNGWNVAALLLEYWLYGDAKVMPENVANGSVSAQEYGSFSTHIVTMEWLKGFARARSEIANLIAVLNSPKAQLRIRELVFKNYPSITSKTTLNIDTTALSVDVLHHKWQFQLLPLGSRLETPDGLTAALGLYHIMAAIRKATLSNGVLKITEVSIYVRDVFDFSGFQPLGCWSDQDVSRLGVQPYCTTFTNNSFREYRLRTGKGMDFLVFSDAISEKVSITVSI